jgi:hypothetical protein
MPFPALDLFAAIIAFDATRFLRGFHTLAVHNGRRGGGVAACPQTDGAAQRLVYLLPDPVQAPLAKGCIGGLPRRILARQIAPGTTGTQDVKKGIDEEPLRPGPRPATRVSAFETGVGFPVR